MKNRILAFLLFATTVVFGQNQIVITTTVTPPFPATTDEMLTFLDQSLITLQNTSPTTTYTIKLSASLRSNSGVVVETKPEAQPPVGITLAPGQTRIYSGIELRMMYDNYGEDDFNFQGITAEELLRDPTLPDGSYQLCMQAFDYNTSQPLSLSSPAGCTAPFLIVAVDPPILVNPVDQSELMPQVPQAFNINWIPVTIANPDLRYRLKMIDITNFDQNLYDALDSDNFLFYSEEDIIGNSIFYGSDKPLLDSGHTYALRVEAYSLTGAINVKNDGKSDVITFTYGSSQSTSPGNNQPNQPVATFNCNEGCEVDMSNVDLLPGGDFSDGDTVRIGNFDLYLMSVTKTGDKYNGTGVILPTSFLKAGVAVDISDLKINSSGVVLEGLASAQKRQGTWIEDSWKELQGAIDPKDLGSNPSQVYQNLTQEQFYLDQLSAVQLSQAMKVPVGYEMGPTKIEVVGINFQATRASMNLFSMFKMDDDQNGDTYLSFGQKGMCISPDGLADSEENSVLYLANNVDFKYSDDLTVTFQKGDGSGDYGSGTYMEINCEGFQEIAAKAVMKFSPDVFVAVNEDGTPSPADTVAATLTATFTDWSDWIGTVDFTTIPSSSSNTGKKAGKKFQYKELEDYVFVVSNAIFDHSIVMNDAAMSFPSEYNGTHNGQDSWEGVYVKNLQIHLPRFIQPDGANDDRVKTNVDDLLIDETGVSGLFTATNVMNKDEGTIGNWMFTVDTLRLKISQNNLLEGRMTGDMQLPVTDTVLDYVADIEFLGNQTKHSYFFNTNEEFNIPMWYASTRITPNSTILLNVNGSDATLTATLHGSVDFEETIDGIPGMELRGISFQDFVIRNKKQPQYLSLGHIGIDQSTTTPKLAGFSASLNDIGLTLDDLATLSLDMGINFTGEENELSAATRLNLANDIDFTSSPFNYQFEGASIDSIAMSADVGPVAIAGTIVFYKDDPDFGKGFEGAINATFVDKVNVQASCLFGNKAIQGSNVKYWYVYGQGSFTVTPIPFISPIDIYGFGGGAYYNLKSKGLPDAADLSSLPSPRSMYEVKQGNLGLKATVVIGMTPEPKTFNGDVTLEVGINTNTWGISTFALNGAGVVMSDMGDRSKAPFKATVGISYDFENQILDAMMDMDLRVPYSDPVATGGGNIHLYREPGKWWFKAGVPDDRIQATVKLGSVEINSGVYFMMGQELPAASIPVEVQNFMNYTPSLVNNMAVSSGTGFAAGANISVEVDDVDLIVCYMDITAMAGFDISVMDYSNCTCSGQSDFGINKWYANGQGYLYGDATFKVLKQEVFACTLGAIVEGGFPNPAGVKGIVKAQFSFLKKDFNVNKSVTFGSICEMELGVDADGNPVVVGSPIEDFELIEDVYPSHGATDVDVMVQPAITWGVETNEIMELTYNDGQGGTVTEYYRFLRTQRWEKVSSGGTSHDYDTEYDANDMKTTFRATTSGQEVTRMLDAQTQYKVIAKVEVQERVNGQWQTYTMATGNNAGEELAVEEINYFTTGDAPNYIDPQYVDFTKPYDRQRYFTYEDMENGLLKFNIQLKPIFDQYSNDGYDLFVRYTPISSNGPSSEVQINLDYELKCYYSIPQLQPETIYRLEVLARKEVPQNNLIAYGGSSSSSNTASSGFSLQGVNSGGTGTISLSTIYANNNYSNLNLIQSSGSGNVTIEEERIYRLHFRTSKYAHMSDKVNSVNLANTSHQTKIAPSYGELGLTMFNNYEQFRLQFTSGERFDVFDIEGHPFKASGSFTWSSVRFYDGLWNRDLPFDVWFSKARRDVYMNGGSSGSNGPGAGGFGGGNNPAMNAAQMRQQILRAQISTGTQFHHRRTWSFTSGYSYAVIDGPLTDAECGLTMPNSSSSGQSSGTPIYLASTSLGFVQVASYSLDIYYRGDLAAKRSYEMVKNNSLFSPGSYPNMFSGNYQFKVSSGVQSNDNSYTPQSTKTFNPYITIP